MNNSITANDLKTKGVSAIETIVRKEGEAIITVRGRTTYVVIPVDKYNNYRDYELEAAVKEARNDFKEGKYTVEPVEEHIKRISK